VVHVEELADQLQKEEESAVNREGSPSNSTFIEEESAVSRERSAANSTERRNQACAEKNPTQIVLRGGISCKQKSP
jgi:hypothetical protein